MKPTFDFVLNLSTEYKKWHGPTAVLRIDVHTIEYLQSMWNLISAFSVVYLIELLR